MVDVIVSENKNLWRIHKLLLVESSDLFKKALNSEFREGHEQRIVFEEDSNAAFTIFVQWLYSGTFTTSNLNVLLQGYVFGDKICCRTFCDLVMHNIRSSTLMNYQVTSSQVLWILENTLPDSKLRNLTIDVVATGVHLKRLQYTDEDWDNLAPVLPDIMKSVAKMAGTRSPPPLLGTLWGGNHFPAPTTEATTSL